MMTVKLNNEIKFNIMKYVIYNNTLSLIINKPVEAKFSIDENLVEFIDNIIERKGNGIFDKIEIYNSDNELQEMVYGYKNLIRNQESLSEAGLFIEVMFDNMSC